MPKDRNAHENKRTLILYRLGIKGRFQCGRSQRAWSCLGKWTSRTVLPPPKKTNLARIKMDLDLFKSGTSSLYGSQCNLKLWPRRSLQFFSHQQHLCCSQLCYTLRKGILSGVQTPAGNERRYSCLLVFSCLPPACCVTLTTQRDS